MLDFEYPKSVSPHIFFFFLNFVDSLGKKFAKVTCFIQIVRAIQTAPLDKVLTFYAKNYARAISLA